MIGQYSLGFLPFFLKAINRKKQYLPHFIALTLSLALLLPPCSEVVTWMVMKNKVTATAAEIEAFTQKIPSTHRLVQPLNGRVIGQVYLWSC